MTTTAELERESRDLKTTIANGDRLYASYPRAVDMERYKAIRLELHTRAGE